MRGIAAAALLMLGFFTNSAFSQAVDGCSTPAMQNLCASGCGSFCSEDPAFLQSNPSFCASVLSGQTEARDDDVCTTLLPGLAEAPAPPEPVEDEKASELTPGVIRATSEDCARFETRSEQVRCMQGSRGRPTCSATAVALEADASLLVTEVRQELSQFGDLLSEDLTDIASRDRLCEFSIDELDQSYKRATQDPEALRTIQRRADDIQDCRDQWEEYLRNGATNPDISDVIVDNTAEETRKNFLPLIEQLQNLSSSITKLEQAASTIDGLIIIHIDFCPAEGIKASAQD